LFLVVTLNLNHSYFRNATGCNGLRDGTATQKTTSTADIVNCRYQINTATVTGIKIILYFVYVTGASLGTRIGETAKMEQQPSYRELWWIKNENTLLVALSDLQVLVGIRLLRMCSTFPCKCLNK